jgi:hypothetical protein
MNVLPTHENQQVDASKLAIKVICMHLCTYAPTASDVRSSDESESNVSPNYSCEAKMLKRKIHLPAYYVLVTLHATCAIELLHTVQIRVLILGSTSGALIGT